MTSARTTFDHMIPAPALVVCAVAVLFAAVSTAADGDLLEVPAEVLAVERHREQVSAAASKAAVAIFAGEQGGGSGVLISADGYALTNFHVTQPAGVAMTCGLSNGKLYDAVLVGLDPTGDLALVKLLGRVDFPFATMADSDDVRVGDPCFTAGNPFLLATNLQPSIAWGIVSGVHRYQFPAGTILEYADCLQVDAAINPGNSGGGLFDGEGRLIGINGRASFEKRGRVNVGVGYAISSNQVRNFLGALKGGRVVDHATLGATVATSFDGKVVVSDILESSDAHRRGLRYDDEVVSLAGRPIRTVNAFKNVLGTLPAGWRVPMTVRREGRRIDLSVRLAGVHSPAELAKIVEQEDPAPPPVPGQPKPQPKTPPKTPRTDEVPEAVRGLYEAKLGFANHHFNRLERDRVAAAIGDRGRFAGRAGGWMLSGRLSGGKPFAIRLADDRAAIDLPTGTSGVDATGDLDENPAPPGSGGLLAALLVWRKLLLAGPSSVGRTEYLGTQPIGMVDGSDAPATSVADVLVSYVSGVEAHAYVVDGEIRGIDLWTDPDVDPCEVRFSGRLPVGGGGKDAGAVPTRIEVSHGGVAFATFTVEAATLDVAAPGEEDRPEGDAAADGEIERSASILPSIPSLAWIAIAAQVATASEATSATVGAVVADAAKRVVKIHGAGGFRGLEAYQSGCLVTPQGHVVTAMSTVLDSEEIDCVLDDGRRFPAKVVGIDPRRELALLRIEGEDFPSFDLLAAEPPPLGGRVFALSNLFGVAAGDERVSVQHGVVSAKVPLEARRGGYEAVYDGEVLLLDFTVNNPGSSGGALVDLRGRLVGILGKELRATTGGTWLNYALPVSEVEAAYREILSGDSNAIAAAPVEPKRRFDPVRLGIVLVPDLFDKTPPFVEAVVPGTPAARAGIRADDLVIAVEGRSVSSRAAVQQLLGSVDAGAAVRLTVVRGGRVVEVDLGPRPPEAAAEPGP
jgi:S1-C subfamily serine protease